jgi:hypothetical protein
MAKPKVSLAAMAAQESQLTSNVVTLQRDDAKQSRTASHTSLYLHPNVRRAIREIAFQFDKKPHDLYLEGIDLMLAKYGKPTSAELGNK